MRGTSVGDRQEMEGQHPERAFYASTRRLSAWCPRWAQHLLVILTESSPTLQPLVNVEKPLVICPSSEEVPHQNLLRHISEPQTSDEVWAKWDTMWSKC